MTSRLGRKNPLGLPIPFLPLRFARLRSLNRGAPGSRTAWPSAALDIGRITDSNAKSSLHGSSWAATSLKTDDGHQTKPHADTPCRGGLGHGCENPKLGMIAIAA